MNPSHGGIAGLATLPQAWAIAACGLAGALVLSCCEFMTAGTSVGTGNPTEIEVAFRNDSGAAQTLTGSLSVYASTQIPVDGYAPAPLLKVDLAGADRASIRADEFKALADSLWPKGSRNGDLYAFNVVVTGGSQGAILRGLKWNKGKNGFELRAGDPGSEARATKARIAGTLSTLVPFQGTVDTATFSLMHEYHLFLYGTGFTSKLSHGAFLLPQVPREKQVGFLLALPRKEHLNSGEDSASVFSLTLALEAGTSNPAKGPVHEQVLLPDSLRIR